MGKRDEPVNGPITEPGVYDLPEAEYHADPVPGGSLSSSGARKLLPPSCPALYKYDRDHPEPKRHFELGSAAHRMVLGLGAEWVLLDYPDYRTKASQQARDAARTTGAVPILSPEHEQIKAMAEAIRAHPLASALLCRDDVEAEQSMFWPDAEFGIWRRARLDTLRPPTRMGGRFIVTDYKTTACAEPAAFTKSVANYGYHQQAAWYTDAAAALLGADPHFVFVAQEKTPPYLVTVCELDTGAMDTGRALNRRAMEIYRDCADTGLWPGYQADSDIAYISLPPWARQREDSYT